MSVKITEAKTTALKPSTTEQPAAPTKELTPEELESAKGKMMEVMGFAPMTDETKEAELKKKQPETAPAAPATQPAAAPAPAPVPPVVPAEPTPKPRRQRIDAEELARKTAEETANRILAAAPKPTVAPAPEPFEMSEEDKHDNDVFSKMEDMKLVDSGTAEKHRQFVKVLADYKAKWQRDHAGEEFDPEAQEHASFYDSNQPQFDQKKFADAEKRLEFDRYYSARAKETDQQRDEEVKTLKRDMRLEKLKPAITSAVADNVADMIKDIDPEAFKFVSTADGLLDLNPGTMAKLNQHDPVLARYLATAIKKVDSAVEEIRKFGDAELARLGYRFSPNENPVHHEIANVADESEKLLMAAPVEARMRDGKQFVPGRQWNKMHADAGQNAEKIATIRSKFWTFNAEDLERLYVASEAGTVKGKMKELEEFSSARSKRGTTVTREPASIRQQATTEEPPQTQERHAPPNLSSSADIVTPPAPGGGVQKNAGDEAIQAAFS